MRNIEGVLKLLTNNDPVPATIIENANKEFEALKAAGIEVKIEQVESVSVRLPKSKRGRKAKGEKQ
jgi:hypothetical protein